jgi:hypothetical protein
MKKNKKRKEHKRNLPGAQTMIHVIWACASSHPVPVVPPSYLPSLPSPVHYSLSCGPGLVVGPCRRLPPRRHCCGRSLSSAHPCLAVAMGGGCLSSCHCCSACSLSPSSLYSLFPVFLMAVLRGAQAAVVIGKSHHCRPPCCPVIAVPAVTS